MIEIADFSFDESLIETEEYKCILKLSKSPSSRKVFGSKIKIFSERLKEICLQNRVVPYNTVIFDTEKQKFNYSFMSTLTKFTENDFFNKHRDKNLTTSSMIHIYTALVYLPTEHTGGELVIHDSDLKVYSTIFDKVHIILIPVGTVFENLIVKSGTVYMFRIPLFRLDLDDYEDIV